MRAVAPVMALAGPGCQKNYVIVFLFAFFAIYIKGFCISRVDNR
jgi:hypothetical protein